MTSFLCSRPVRSTPSTYIGAGVAPLAGAGNGVRTGERGYRGVKQGRKRDVCGVFGVCGAKKLEKQLFCIGGKLVGNGEEDDPRMARMGPMDEMDTIDGMERLSEINSWSGGDWQPLRGNSVLADRVLAAGPDRAALGAPRAGSARRRLSAWSFPPVDAGGRLGPGCQVAMNGESLYKIAALMGKFPGIRLRHCTAMVPESLTDAGDLCTAKNVVFS